MHQRSMVTDMHTIEGLVATFNHNGDFSGDVKITIPTYYAGGAVQEKYVYLPNAGPEDVEETVTIQVPFGDLKRLVASYVLSRRIEKLEQAEDDEILGV